MCGRYTLTTPDLTPIAEALGVRLPAVKPSYNIAPGRRVPIIRVGEQGYELVEALWGLIPHWAREPKTGYSTINARAETVAEKPAFRAAFRRRRCLLPADGFYEWQKPQAPQLGGQAASAASSFSPAEGRGGGAFPAGKQPFYIHRRDHRVFAFAGLWDRWQGEGMVIDSCTIIVTAANALMAPIHERMPVILPAAAYRLWLDPMTPREKLLSLLAPWPGDEFVADPVSTRVNNPRNDDPDLVSPRP